MVIREWLCKCPLIAILRGIKPHEVEDVFGGLLAAGVIIAEIPLNSPEPTKSIRLATDLYGSKMLIGAGTVTRAVEVAQVREAGAKLVVCPCADAAIVHEAKLHKMLSINKRSLDYLANKHISVRRIGDRGLISMVDWKRYCRVDHPQRVAG